MRHNEAIMQLLVASDATSADLHIMGNVTRGHWLFGKGADDTDAADVAKALADLPETCGQITVHINSMGGEVAQGVAIYNVLKSHKAHVTTVCEGFACSIASVIFMAGDERVMRDASLLMIHEAWMGARGNAKDLRKAADDLETITELSKRAYMAHATGELTREMLDQLMAEETWILPEQAVAWGLATQVDGPDDDDDDDDDEPEQSAMRALMRRLAGEPLTFHATRDEVERIAQRVAVLESAPAHYDLSDGDVARIAQAVADALAAKAAPDPDPAPEPAQEPNMSFMQRAALMYAE